MDHFYKAPPVEAFPYLATHGLLVKASPAHPQGFIPFKAAPNKAPPLAPPPAPSRLPRIPPPTLPGRRDWPPSLPYRLAWKAPPAIPPFSTWLVTTAPPHPTDIQLHLAQVHILVPDEAWYVICRFLAGL